MVHPPCWHDEFDYSFITNTGDVKVFINRVKVYSAKYPEMAGEGHGAIHGIC